MSQDNVNAFLSTKIKYLPAEAVPMLRQKLERLSQEQLTTLQAVELKDPTTVFLLALFLCGVDRMFIGQVGLGILKMLTGGGCGIWWLIDLFLIGKATRQANLDKLNETLMLLG